MSVFSLAGKLAVVTGAGRGIGAAIATALARNGANVACLDLNEATAEETARALREQGASSRGYACDVTDFASVDHAFTQLEELQGEAEILVNNAGFQRFVATLEMTDEANLETLAVNYLGVEHCCRRALPVMIERGGGRIVSIASVAAFAGTGRESSHYAASKAAVVAYTKSLAKEFGPHGVTANAVAPGQIDTEMGRGRLEEDPEHLNRFAATLPLRRIGQPEDVANACVFLASDAASYITGQVLPVCGGYLIA